MLIGRQACTPSGCGSGTRERSSGSRRKPRCRRTCAACWTAADPPAVAVRRSELDRVQFLYGVDACQPSVPGGLLGLLAHPTPACLLRRLLLPPSWPIAANSATAAMMSRNASRRAPRRALAEVEEREHREHRQRHHLLNHLQLRRGERAVADPVRRHLEAVLRQRDQPTHEDRGDETRRACTSGGRTTRPS